MHVTRRVYYEGHTDRCQRLPFCVQSKAFNFRCRRVLYMCNESLLMIAARQTRVSCTDLGIKIYRFHIFKILLTSNKLRTHE